MKIETGTKIIVVRPNTSKDPLNHCLNKFKYYNPITSYELEIASEPYTSNGHSCFDVVGDSGLKNKGQTEGTRKTWFSDIGIVPLGERVHMECGGFTRAFTSQKEADFYISELLNEQNFLRVMKNSLELWGINTEKKHVEEFIKMNDKNK